MADGRTTREKAAQARAAQLAAEKRSQRRVQIIGGALVALVAVAIIGVAVLAARSDSSSSGIALPAPDAKAALPAGALGPDSPTPYGIPVGEAPETASTVVVWEDFQCPFCAQFERTQGAELQALGESGDVKLIYRPATFLDDAFPQSNLSSARATNAWGAAIDAGKGDEYHALVFVNQPTLEGDGFTDEQLLDFGKQVGISGADYDAFAKKVADRTYVDWVSNSSQAFRNAAVPGPRTSPLMGSKCHRSTWSRGSSSTSTPCARSRAQPKPNSPRPDAAPTAQLPGRRRGRRPQGRRPRDVQLGSQSSGVVTTSVRRWVSSRICAAWGRSRSACSA